MGTKKARQSRAQRSADKKMQAPSYPVELLKQHIAGLRFVKPVEEHVFHTERMWRFDLAWPDMMLAVEVEGGVHLMGRHQRPDGFHNDCEKYNEAALAGWTLLRFTPAMIRKGEAIGVLERFFQTFHPTEVKHEHPAEDTGTG